MAGRAILVLLALLSFGAEAKVHFHKWKINYQTWAPDCVQVNIIPINGQYPGPTIRAREGDTVVFQLENLMPTENVVIHWHGIRQPGKEPFAYDGELSIVLNDWWHKSTYEMAVGLSSNPFVWVGEPQEYNYAEGVPSMKFANSLSLSTVEKRMQDHPE